MAYTRVSLSGALGAEIHTGTIIDVLPPSPPFTEHDNEAVLS